MEADGMTQEWTFWGARGEKLGTFGMVYNLYVGDATHPYLPVLSQTLAFAGKTIWDGGKPLVQDRVGSNAATGGFYPYGDEITATANDRTKFATYHRDGFTGLDYADQRYYASVYGRFNTADPYDGSAKPNNPVSWNRFAYVGGDPINLSDPHGLEVQDCSDNWIGDASASGPCCLPGAYWSDPTDEAACYTGEPGGDGASDAAPPECELAAYTRGLDALGGMTLPGAKHAYLQFTDANGVATIFEGQDKGGLLKAAGSRYSGSPDGYLPSDKPKNDTPIGDEEGSSICDLFKTLTSDVDRINSANSVSYGKFGPNSNSVFRYFLQSLPSTSWVNVPFLIGYSSSIPGLN